jgi:hypothetical protein
MVSNTLAQEPDLVVLERLQMTELLKEIELEQTGLFNEEKVRLQGKFLRADYLILGVYSNQGNMIHLQIKAVNISTGAIYAARSVSANIAGLMDKVKSISQELAILLSGKNYAILKIFSNPNHATIYINGELAGNTPLVSYKIPPGKHEILLIKENYENYKTSVELESESNTNEKKVFNIDALMLRQRAISRSGLHAGVFYLKPDNKALREDYLFLLAFSHSFGNIELGLEAGVNNSLDHSYGYPVPYSSRKEERSYRLLLVDVNLKYDFLNLWQRFSAYGGMSAGYILLADRGYSPDFFMEESRKYHIFMGGVLLGVNLFPYSVFSIFIEGRYNYSFSNISRETISGINFLGQSSYQEEKFHFSYLNLGFGFRLRFN